MNLRQRFILIPLALGSLAAPGAQAAPASELYQQRCAQCHSGAAGVPQLGDHAEWALRVRAGMSNLQRSALLGIPNTAMAAKGGHRDLAESDVAAIVEYMVGKAGIDAETRQAAAQYEARGITDREFIRLDGDFDGFLSPNELAQEPDILNSLDRFDADRDGRLSESEYLRLEAGLEQARAAVRVDDAVLVGRVRAALAAVAGMPKNGITVKAVNGDVTMAGVVEDGEAMRRAYAAVKRIKGIKKIDNRLVSSVALGFD